MQTESRTISTRGPARGRVDVRAVLPKMLCTRDAESTQAEVVVSQRQPQDGPSDPGPSGHAHRAKRTGYVCYPPSLKSMIRVCRPQVGPHHERAVSRGLFVHMCTNFRPSCVRAAFTAIGRAAGPGRPSWVAFAACQARACSLLERPSCIRSMSPRWRRWRVRSLSVLAAFAALSPRWAGGAGVFALRAS